MNLPQDGPKHFRDLLRLSDRFRYLLWRGIGSQSPLRCRMSNGPTIQIRPRPCSDYDTAYEIFFARTYESSMDASSVHRVVDLGGNVGFSCLYWCWKYPEASVVTFEPHPAHCSQIDWHLRENGWANRVEVVRAAAGGNAGKATLTDSQDASTVVQDPALTQNGRTIQIEVVDVFDSIGREPIDILKMDIEGSEYGIVADRRFDELAVRTRSIFLEWHQREPHHLGKQWCAERLSGLGFKVEEGRGCSEYGILYGVRG